MASRPTAHQSSDAHEAARKRVVSRLNKARQNRQMVEAVLDDCYRYALPGRAGFSGKRAMHDMEDLYDHTAVVALEDFASLLHARVTPYHTAWVRLEANERVHPDDRDAVNRDLEEIQNLMFDEIHSSNFGQEAQEAFLDLGCSTGHMLVEEWRGQLIHTAIPLTQVYPERGVRDQVGGIFREREMPLRLLEAEYPNGMFEGDLAKQMANEPEKEVTVIDGMWHEHKGGIAGHETVMVQTGHGTGHIIRDRDFRGYGSVPFMGYRWSKAAGEVLGRGPIMKVLPGVRTTNLVMEMTLQNAALALSGMYALDDDGVVNIDTIRIAPGVIIPRRPGTRGLERIDMGGTEFRISDIILSDQRNDIRNATFSDALGSPDKTPFKATEVEARMQMHAERVSANFGRLRSEMLEPYIRRILWLLERRRDIKLPVPISMIRIEPTGPLARAIKANAINSIMTYVNLRQMIWGPQYAPMSLHEERTDAVIREMLSVPLAVRATKAEMEENMEQAQTVATMAQASQAM